MKRCFISSFRCFISSFRCFISYFRSLFGLYFGLRSFGRTLSAVRSKDNLNCIVAEGETLENIKVKMMDGFYNDGI